MGISEQVGRSDDGLSVGSVVTLTAGCVNAPQGDVPRVSIVKAIEKQMGALDLMVQAIESYAADMHGLKVRVDLPTLLRSSSEQQPGCAA